ncbi:MAG: sigma-70 family RNA polymerase sigma factor, partial [Planctomycetia bacterium]|nr:sigma-70 family RNA polymerase sigma factor [Planctomycetia bacterium]
MPQAPLAAVVQHLRRWIGGRAAADQADDRLLQRFAEARDEAAFAELMRRHGPVVLGVCRRVLADGHDADDAFQATFLVLARKAASIRQGEALGGWLCRVACRIALAAKTASARRRAGERQALDMKPTTTMNEPAWAELRPLLDEEVDRLPRKYRVPVVLCYFEGKTHEEAAQQLGWPKGTVAGRLARARDLLHQRLTRRGVTLSAAGFAALLTELPASAAVPPTLFATTLQSAIAYSAGQSAAVTSAVLLAEGAMRTMFLTKIKIAAGVCLAVGILGTGLGTYLHQSATAQPAVGEVQKVQLSAPVGKAQLPAPVGPGGGRDVAPGGNLFTAFNQAETLFTAKVVNVVLGPVGLSEPPLHSMKITFEDVKMLRGKQPAGLTFSYSIRAPQAPQFNQGEMVLVAASALRISTIVPAKEADVALAKKAISVPIGWTLENDKPVSPWASLGDKAKLPGLKSEVVCAKSGRPALLAGDVEFKVEKIIPAKVQQYKNPFGDGEFKLTVTNPGKEAVVVPALLTDGQQIHWADSVLIVQNQKTHILPAAGTTKGNLQSVKLAPGASVTGTINTLQLKDVSWP